jgi:hypothetical protein
LASGSVGAIVGLVDHDFILSSFARDTIERAQAEAARHRLVIEARRAGEECTISDATRLGPFRVLVALVRDRVLTIARPGTR